MTDLRQAAQQALEALEQCGLDDTHRSHEFEHAARAALRAALAQQAEPVEPVAEARYDGTLRWLKPHGVGLHRIQGPLYTAPPQRKPLTEEEIDAIAATNLGDYEDDKWFLLFARAVERAHGIGEEK